jgi:hypothetical protein
VVIQIHICELGVFDVLNAQDLQVQGLQAYLIIFIDSDVQSMLVADQGLVDVVLALLP